MKRLKRFLCIFLTSFMVVAVPVNGYVQGAAVPVAVGAWEVLQTIFLSLGVTVAFSSALNKNEAAKELIDRYNGWTVLNGGGDNSKLDPDLKPEIIGQGASIKIGEEIWNGLKKWVGSLVKGDSSLGDGSKIGFNNKRFISYTMESSYSGGIIQLKGDTFYKVTDNAGNPLQYGVAAYAYGSENKIYNAFVFSTQPFIVSARMLGDYSWKKLPSNYRDVPYKNVDRTVEYSSAKNPVGRLYYADCGVCHYLSSIKSINCPVVETKSSSPGSALFEALRIIQSDYLNLDEPDKFSWDALGGSAVHENWDVATPGRQWDGEALTGEVTLKVPENISDLADKVASGELSIPEALPGAVPVNPSSGQAIYSNESIPDVLSGLESGGHAVPDEGSGESVVTPDIQTDSEFMVDGLKGVFPFCIPFDILDFLNVLSAPAEAPHFKFPIRYPTGSGWSEYEIDVDLSKFDSVAELLRTGETLLFCVGLMVATRSLYLRG